MNSKQSDCRNRSLQSPAVIATLYPTWVKFCEQKAETLANWACPVVSKAHRSTFVSTMHQHTASPGGWHMCEDQLHPQPLKAGPETVECARSCSVQALDPPGAQRVSCQCATDTLRIWAAVTGQASVDDGHAGMYTVWTWPWWTYVCVCGWTTLPVTVDSLPLFAWHSPSAGVAVQHSCGKKGLTQMCIREP